jgi:flagellin
VIINHNLSSMNALHFLNVNNNALQNALEHLSSGKRINGAADDAAGLAISEKMKGQIDGLDQASRNAQDAISMIQTAEGALNETHSILQRMRDLATQAANDTNTDQDRENIQLEMDQLAQEITRIANTTQFNTQTLLNGGMQAGNLGVDTFQIGANTGQTISLSIRAMDAASLGVAGASLSAGVQTGATAITSASISGATGVGLKGGATLTISTTADNGAQATGSLAVTGNGTVTVTAQSVGTALNGVKITFAADNDQAISTSWNAQTNTLTVSADWDGSANSGANQPTALADIEAAINAGLQQAGFGANAVTLSQTGTFDATGFVNAGTITLSNGAAADPTKSVVTIDDGSANGAGVQTIVVDNSASSITVTSGRYKGLTINTTDATASAGTITITQTLATAAQFSNGVKTADAVANKGIDVTSQDKATNAITVIDNAIQTVSAERAKLGAYQNRLEHTINNLSTASENLTAASSRITDVDMAKAMAEFTKENVLQQAAVSMLAQANQQPQMVLKLLG